MNIILPINPTQQLRAVSKYGLKLIALSICVVSLTNCGGTMGRSFEAPAIVEASGSLNKNSVSDSKRTLVKTGSLSLKTENVRQASETVEQIVAKAGGHMTGMNERDDKTKNADFDILVPSQHLVSTMDKIAELGKVSYRNVYVRDLTSEAIRQLAKLKKLKARRDRLKALYSRAGSLADKLKIEETLAEIEEQIFSMEAAIKQIQKTSNFSKLSVSISQKKIRGPLGIVKDTGVWSLKKLFTIRE